jgi:hypothetical protein
VVTLPVEGGQASGWPPPRKPRRCWKAAKTAKTANTIGTLLTLLDGFGAGAGLLEVGRALAGGECEGGRLWRGEWPEEQGGQRGARRPRARCAFAQHRRQEDQEDQEDQRIGDSCDIVDTCDSVGDVEAGAWDAGVGLPVRRGGRAGRPEVSQGYTGGECVRGQCRREAGRGSKKAKSSKMPPGARRQGRGAREASTGVKAPRCQGAMQYCSWPPCWSRAPHLGPGSGYARGRGPVRMLDGVGRGPRRPLALFQEAAPVLEGGQAMVLAVKRPE